MQAVSKVLKVMFAILKLTLFSITETMTVECGLTKLLRNKMARVFPHRMSSRRMILRL